MLNFGGVSEGCVFVFFFVAPVGKKTGAIQPVEVVKKKAVPNALSEELGVTAYKKRI